MLQQRFKEGAKPAGFIYVVPYVDDRREAAAAFSDRDKADEFCRARGALSAESDCTTVKTVVDGITGPTRN